MQEHSVNPAVNMAEDRAMDNFVEPTMEGMDQLLRNQKDTLTPRQRYKKV